MRDSTSPSGEAPGWQWNDERACYVYWDGQAYTVSDQPQGPGWWRASNGWWYSQSLKPKPSNEPSYKKWSDPFPWAISAVMAGWFGLFSILYLVGMDADVSGSADGCAGKVDLSDYQQCARDEELFILNFHAVVVAVGVFGLVFAVRGVRHRGFGRELRSPSRLTTALVLAALLLATTALWRIRGSSGIAVHDRPFDPLSTDAVLRAIFLGATVGCVLGLAPLKRRRVGSDATRPIEDSTPEATET